VDNQDSSTSPSGQANQQSEAQIVPNAAPQENEMGKDAERTANNEKTETQELAHEFRVAEKWTIGINGGLAIIGILALFVYYGQLKEMKRSTDAAVKAADAATNQTVLMRQQLVGTMSSSFALNGPELVSDKVRIGWVKSGQVISREFHATFRISEASFPGLKQSWESQIYTVDMKPVLGSFSDKYQIPKFAPSDRQFPTQTHTIIVKGEFSFDDGFGQIFNRQFCGIYFGIYQYTAVNEGGSVTDGGFQNCKDVERKLIQFRRRELP